MSAVPVSNIVALLVWASVALLGFQSGSARAAETRVALVIGNSAYLHANKLPNPKNDAGDMAQTLKALGYKVLLGTDLDKAGMDRMIREFARALPNADAGIFFYAGHGLQVKGLNYLVPVDAKLDDTSGLDFEMVRLDLIHGTMERESRTNVIFLDACRDNPLARNLARAMGTRSTSDIGTGLAKVEFGSGTLISFSTQPGNVALDGVGRNSPFTEALVKRIKTVAATEDLSRLLIGVRNDVMAATRTSRCRGRTRRCARRSSSRRPKRRPPASAATTEIRPRAGADVLELGQRISRSSVLIQTYLDRYPDGHFAPLARALIEHLNKEDAAKGSVAESKAQALQAEEAAKAANVRQEQERKKIEEAKQAGEIATAKEELRKAQEALERAKSEKAAALAAAEQAQREADQAKAAQSLAIKRAEQQEKTASANPAKTKTPAAEAAPAPPKEPQPPPAEIRPVPDTAQPGAEQPLRVQLANAKALRSVAVSKDGITVAMAGDDGRIRFLNPADLTLTRTLDAHRERILSVAFSANDKLLASAGWDGGIGLLNLATWQSEKLATGPERLFSVAFDPKVEFVLAGDAKGHVQIWSLKRKAKQGNPLDHDGHVRAVSFMPDGEGTFVSISSGGKMRVRSWKSGMRDTEAHAGGGFYAGYSPSGEFILSGGGDKKLKLWRAADLKLVRTYEGHTKYVLAAAFAPDGKTFVSAGGDRSLMLWDVQSGQRIKTFDGHAGDVQSVAFNADGTRIFSVAEDKTLRLWEVAGGQQLAVAVGFADGEYLAYTPDGKYTGSPRAHVHLKMLEGGSERAVDDSSRTRFFLPSGLVLGRKG